MKRLCIFIFLVIILFNWIGYQYYTAVANRDARQDFTPMSIQENGMDKKMPEFHIALYQKELDFDDLLEFTASPNHSANEICFHISNDVLANNTGRDNRIISFKCFNGEYYYTADKLFTKYPDIHAAGKIHDRYLLKIPIVFLSPKEYPPQYAA